MGTDYWQEQQGGGGTQYGASVLHESVRERDFEADTGYRLIRICGQSSDGSSAPHRHQTGVDNHSTYQILRPVLGSRQPRRSTPTPAPGRTCLGVTIKRRLRTFPLPLAISCIDRLRRRLIDCGPGLAHRTRCRRNSRFSAGCNQGLCAVFTAMGAARRI
jgi:hypothetical protein